MRLIPSAVGATLALLTPTSFALIGRGAAESTMPLIWTAMAENQSCPN